MFQNNCSFLILLPHFLLTFLCSVDVRHYNTHGFQTTLPIVHHAATRSALFRRKSDYSSSSNRPFGIRSTTLSPLNTIFHKLRSIRSQRTYHRSNTSSSSSSSSSTALNMVFTTPSSIIEQASTKILLDDLIDESVRSVPRTTVMMQFDPSSGWIWRRWKGTVFSETWRICLINMMYAFIITLIYKLNQSSLNNILAGFSVLWGQLLSVTTFTLTFFLNQSYALWRNCYGYSRRLQGRLNDLNMTMAAHAKRVEPNRKTGDAVRSDSDDKNDMSEKKSPINGSSTPVDDTPTLNGSGVITNTAPPPPPTATNGFVSDSKFSTYTEPAREVLELMARYTRVFNLLTYASFTGSHRPLLTPQGMRRMVDRGIITESERQILSDVQLPVTQRHNALLLWIMRLFEDARQAGHLEGSSGFEQQFLEKCHVIRAQYGAIGDELQGRMPLAYAHIVQVLVDVILWMYPFMAISSGMTPFLSVLGTGLLTMFYQGLFNLAKQFLDPYDNESYGKGEDPLCIDTLIAESNAGSVRWMNGLAEIPYSVDNVQIGDMLKYQLPLRGWTVGQTAEREEEARIEKERLEKEEAEKKLAEEAGLVEPVLQIDEDLEVLMRGDDDNDDKYCIDDEDLTMEEALEKMEECTEKVP